MNELSEALQGLVKKFGFTRILRTLARIADEVADGEEDHDKAAAFQSVGGRMRSAAQLLQTAKEQQADEQPG